MRDVTRCIYYNDGCGTCIECYVEKCPATVEQMTEEEKKFYGVKEDGRQQE